MLLRLQNAFRSMTSMTREQERIANNLANANTIGFKHDRTFTTALDEYLDAEGGPQSVRETQQWASLEAGALESTGNPLDVAIGGEGFFVLSDDAAGATRYTRAGRFTADGQGMLRDPHGYQVEGDGGPIQLPRDVGEISIHDDGTIQADGQDIGRLQIVRFEDPRGLQRLEGAAFSAEGLEPIRVENPEVRQGFLESSNVDPLSEMSDMITHFRLFESQQKMLQTQDQILGHVTRELGKF